MTIPSASLVPFIFWNKHGRVTYRSSMVEAMQNRDYAIGRLPPNYPVPAIPKINPLIEAYICRDLYRWMKDY